ITAARHWAVAPVHARWHRRRRRRCRARAALPVYGGNRERGEPGETSKRSWRPPFINRLYPAETRLKEGATAHDSDRTGGSVPLPRVGGALSARSVQYPVAASSVSKARVGRPSVHDAPEHRRRVAGA